MEAAFDSSVAWVNGLPFPWAGIVSVLVMTIASGICALPLFVLGLKLVDDDHQTGEVKMNEHDKQEGWHIQRRKAVRGQTIPNMIATLNAGVTPCPPRKLWFRHRMRHILNNPPGFSPTLHLERCELCGLVREFGTGHTQDQREIAYACVLALSIVGMAVGFWGFVIGDHRVEIGALIVLLIAFGLMMSAKPKSGGERRRKTDEELHG